MKDWNGNANSIYKTLGASNHTKEEREDNDYYATDPIAIDKLLRVEKLSKYVWECACGEGHIVKRLKDYGHSVRASDIIERMQYGEQEVIDFLSVQSCVPIYDIVTNPPYKYAKEFVLHALDLITQGHKVCMFLKLTFLEGKARYQELFSKYPPKTIYVFSERVGCAKNGNFSKDMTKAVAYAWFIWEKGYKGDTTIKWI